MRNAVHKHALALALAAAAAAASAQQIDGLQVHADAGMEPGSTLRFSLEGTPRSQAQVTLNVNGGKVSVPMREVRPGFYEGHYVVKRSDRIDPNGLVATRITTGNRWVATNFTYPQSFLAQSQPQQPPAAPQAAARIERFTAASDAPALEPGAQVRFVLRGAPGGTATVGIPGVASDVRLREVNPGVYRGNYVVRRNDNVNGFASAAATLRVGNTSVQSNLSEPMTARVPVGTGNTTAMGASAPTALPLQVLSPGPNAAIEGGQVVTGRTAPGAMVRIRVDAVPPVVGNRLGVAQTVAEQTVQADANGNFSFNFGPQRHLPGTRYEVSMTANQGTQTAEQRLVLFQRG
ncbi:MAG TPA: hypothetical protein VEA35_09460 [Ramlibacter sp.]|nr:hypothetical protein [Ramlibacter sp.]